MGMHKHLPEPQLFKLQRPLAFSRAVPEVLIYNEGHSVLGQVPLDGDLTNLFGQDFKVYCWGTIDQSGVIAIDTENKLPKSKWPNW